MSKFLDRVYGTFFKNVEGPDVLYQELWEKLAPRYADETMKDLTQSNLGLTQKKIEIIELWRLFHRAQPEVILEIGVSQGGTFAGWCQLAPDNALLIALDLNTDDCRPRPGDPIDPSLMCSTELKLTSHGGGVHSLKKGNQTIKVVNGWSFAPEVFEQVKSILNGRTIDFIFHDASHQHEMTRRDFALYWPLVSPGGMMAFHDIGYSSAKEVDKMIWWKEVIDKGDFEYSFEWKMGASHDNSMGIGVLIKGE